MKVLKGEKPRRPADVVARSVLPDLVRKPLGVGHGGPGLPLDFDEEPAELLGVHLGASLGVGCEDLLHVGGKLALRRVELAGEAEAHLVAPHPPPPFLSSLPIPNQSPRPRSTQRVRSGRRRGR